MAAVFGRLGISSEVQVIVYDEITGIFASRFWWMLRYLGHEAVAVLDGGFAKWVREGRAVRAGDETRPAATFAGRARAGMAVELPEVQSRLGTREMLLVDARAPERFAGLTEPLDRIPGHIPGAVNRHYAENLTADGTLRPAGELREEFSRVMGTRAPEQVVMYCGSGVSACQNLLALEHAGIQGVRLYPGSYSEWAADPARPIESG